MPLARICSTWTWASRGCQRCAVLGETPSQCLQKLDQNENRKCTCYLLSPASFSSGHDMFPWQLSNTCFQTWLSKPLSISHSLGLDYCASHPHGTQHDRVQGWGWKKDPKTASSGKSGAENPITSHHSLPASIVTIWSICHNQLNYWCPKRKQSHPQGVFVTIFQNSEGHRWSFHAGHMLSCPAPEQNPCQALGLEYLFNALSRRPKDVELTQCDVVNGSLCNSRSLSWPRNEDALFLLVLLINEILEGSIRDTSEPRKIERGGVKQKSEESKQAKSAGNWKAQRNEESREVKRAEKWREHGNEESKEVKRAEESRSGEVKRVEKSWEQRSGKSKGAKIGCLHALDCCRGCHRSTGTFDRSHWNGSVHNFIAFCNCTS